MAARLVLNRVVQGRSSTACTRLGSNRWMFSVKSRLEFVHVDVFCVSLFQYVCVFAYVFFVVSFLVCKPHSF